jgi:penicillin-binding protein 1C
VPLAWKTGTSYGYRDAWAIGLNSRYLIGVWTGRPDSTPVAGQFGLGSAVPLLNQVNNLLQAGSRVQQARLPADPRPASVSAGEICWPGGQYLPPGDSNCRRRLSSWLLDKSEPPTLQAPGQESIQGIQQRIWLDNQGHRVAADCAGAKEREIALWPLPLEPWLPLSERRALRLPPASETCPPLQKNDVTPLLLLGVREGAILKRLPGQTQLLLRLSSQGGQGDRWWFLNGVALGRTDAGVALSLAKSGKYQVLVLDGSGQVAAANFTVQ